MLEYWYSALASPHGIKLSVSDIPTAQRKLYAARADACDESLKVLALVPSPSTPNEIWIIHAPKRVRSVTESNDQSVPNGLGVDAIDILENGSIEGIEDVTP